jgi:hypothetical protein
MNRLLDGNSCPAFTLSIPYADLLRTMALRGSRTEAVARDLPHAIEPMTLE